MAKRPIFLAGDSSNGFYRQEMIEFKFYNGFALSQKAKSIASLHNAAKERFDINILEVSTKSTDKIGWGLSAFNMQVALDADRSITLESAFQGSKVFEGGVQYDDIYYKSPLDAKKDDRLKSSGHIIGFSWQDVWWENDPQTAFYDWLYINALHANKQLSKEIMNYDAFSDIEFNPKKSLNCQARSSAIYVSLVKNGMIEDVLHSKDDFIGIIYPKNTKQGSLFDPN